MMLEAEHCDIIQRRWVCSPRGWCKLFGTSFDFLNVFVESPGALLYFLLVIALSQAALFLSLGQRTRFRLELSTQRYVLAAALLVVMWLLVFAAALLATLAELDPNMIMPPLERLAYALTFAVMTWAFLSADFIQWKNRANAALLSAAVILVLLYLLTAIQWLAAFDADAEFNRSLFAPLWAWLPVLVALAGLAVTALNVEQVIDAPLKSVVFALMLLGNGWNLFEFAQGEIPGDYLGAARLVYLGGLVLLPVIIYRLSIALLENSLVEVVLAASRPTASLPAIEPAPAIAPIAPAPPGLHAAAAPPDASQLLKAIGLMLQRGDGIPEQIVRAVLEVLSAELCALLRVSDMQYADVIAGYDAIVDQPLATFSLNLNDQPTLLDALRGRRAAVLLPEAHPDELEDLFRRLNIGVQGQVYAQPLLRQRELIAVLLVSMPYRQGEFSPAEIRLLDDVGFAAGSILAREFEAQAAAAQAEEQALQAMAERDALDADDALTLEAARRGMAAGLRGAAAQIAALYEELSELALQRDAERLRLFSALAAGEAPALQRMTLLFDEQTQLRDEHRRRERELLEAVTVLRTVKAADDEALARVIKESLGAEYQLLARRRDRLQQQIRDLQQRADAADGADLPAAADAFADALAEETARLEAHRSQLEDRLTALQSQLHATGVAADLAGLTQILIQLYVERKILRQRLEGVYQERGRLLQERKRLDAAAGVDVEKLQRQVKHLTADQESFINLREQMRKDYQNLLTKFKALRKQKSKLQKQLQTLRTSAAASGIEQERLNQQMAELADERDNLLTIRDQLTAKMVALLKDSARRDAAPQPPAEKAALAVGADDQKPAAQLTDLAQQLQTPMAAIVDYVELLLGESVGILGAAQLEFLQRISANTLRLTALVNELIKAAQLDARQIAPVHAQVDVVGLIDAAVTDAARQLRAKEQVIALSLADALPKIALDGAGLKHILHLLLSNAGRASPAGSEILIAAKVERLRLEKAAEPLDVVKISVHDKGGGIHAADIPRVFARKYRADNPAIKGLGDSGVGMTVARAFARAGAGDLWLVSEPGEGSVFHLALPAQQLPTVEE